MTMNSPALPIDLNAVNSFWFECWEKIAWHSNSALFGEQENTGLIPPAFQYSQNRAEADSIAREVVDGSKRTFETPEHDFTDVGEGLPNVGDMSIICNGEGQPVALLSDVAVTKKQNPHRPGQVIVVETFEVLYPNSK